MPVVIVLAHSIHNSTLTVPGHRTVAAAAWQTRKGGGTHNRRGQRMHVSWMEHVGKDK